MKLAEVAKNEAQKFFHGNVMGAGLGMNGLNCPKLTIGLAGMSNRKLVILSCLTVFLKTRRMTT